ncbi:hypothetical protein ACIQZI_03595 [Peribacillus sp. NPDC096379]
MLHLATRQNGYTGIQQKVTIITVERIVVPLFEDVQRSDPLPLVQKPEK